MKKIFGLVLLFIFLFNSSCYGFSDLYSLKSSKQDYIETMVEDFFTSKKYLILKKNPYLAVSEKNNKNNAIIVLRQNGEDLFYYFESDKKVKDLNNDFLKLLKKNKIKYEKIDNQSYIDSFSNTAEKTIKNQETVYDFENGKKEEKSGAEWEIPKTVLKGFVAKTGKGKILRVSLQNAIDTQTAKIGDEVTTILLDDWTYDDRYIIAPQGSIIKGKLTKASPAEVGLRNAKLQINFCTLITPDIREYELSAEKLDFQITNDGIVISTLTHIALAAVAGVLVGLGYAVMSGGDVVNAVVIGSAIAAGTELVISVANKGMDSEIPSMTELAVILTKDISVVINY